MRAGINGRISQNNCGILWRIDPSSILKHCFAQSRPMALMFVTHKEKTVLHNALARNTSEHFCGILRRRSRATPPHQSGRIRPLAPLGTQVVLRQLLAERHVWDRATQELRELRERTHTEAGRSRALGGLADRMMFYGPIRSPHLGKMF